MKKMLLLCLLGLGVQAFAAKNEMMLNLDNLQQVHEILCIEGKYHVLAEIDDNLDAVLLYRVINGKEETIPCKAKQLKTTSEKQKAK